MRASLFRLQSTASRVKAVNDIQRLYYMHPSSPGSVFFLPNGTHIVAKLVEYMRSQMRNHGFKEVITPQLFKNDLWKQSGHWDHYKEDMFSVKGGTAEEEEQFSLKPMNCPGHCLIFKSQERSFRELPIRYADFSPLHRNESSGALTGLTRVRRFHQDDGHIFCQLGQVKTEIASSLRLVDSVYRVFGLTYQPVLSTRPTEGFIGDPKVWDEAESQLKTALIESLPQLEGKITINEGDGAFYGPKIDFIVTDALGKQHQAATIQLDFQLPNQFKLKYDDDHMEQQTPVMIHRAVLGSVERFLALLIDHYGGKWPFWLNPLQAVVVPVSDAHVEYANNIKNSLGDYEVEVWSMAEPVGGRIRRAIEHAANYIIVVGDREVENQTASVRDRDGNKKLVAMSLDELKQLFQKKAVPQP